jgi:hypothetical protein
MSSMNTLLRAAVMATFVTSLAACGGGAGAGSAPPISTAIKTPLLIRDAADENWAQVGVKVLSITLTQQGGGAVSVYAPATPATVNLAQLDQVSDLIASSIPAGTYSGATITLAANPGEVTLTVGQDPESGFSGAPGTQIPSSQIVVNGASGASGSQTVAINVVFEHAITVSASQSTPVEFDFDLSHPAFVISHAEIGGMTMYAVSFNGGPVKRHEVRRVTDLVLRHFYGTVASIAADNRSFVLNREVPTLPIVTPETAVATGDTTTILVDATNGTLYYDLDATPTTPTSITDLSTVASVLPGRQLRIQARYQADGSLVATRLFSSAAFATVWRSPEGHVLRVDQNGGRLIVATESGTPSMLVIDANTAFVLPNQPASSPPIGTGPGFLANLRRGFKVHATVDSANPQLATLVEIETAAFGGRIENATTLSFDYAADFRHHGDAYTVTLPYIDPTTANGTDGSGNPVTGFKYWNFAYPTLVTTTNAISNFVSAVGGTVGFGGVTSPLYAKGVTHAVWGDAAAPTGWAAPWVALVPTKLPLAFVATAVAGNAFSVTAPGGTTAVTVGFGTTAGSATLVYEVGRSSNHVTVTPQDISTPAGLTALVNGLAIGAPVKISGIPQADGTMKAYVIAYFTGSQPTSSD